MGAWMMMLGSLSRSDPDYLTCLIIKQKSNEFKTNMASIINDRDSTKTRMEINIGKNHCDFSLKSFTRVNLRLQQESESLH